MYLITKIVLFLVLAFAFGFAVAWLAWREHTARREAELTARWEQRLGDLQRQSETQLAKYRHEVDESRQQIPTLEASLADRSDLIARLEADLLEWRERLPPIESLLAQRNEHIAELEQQQGALQNTIDQLEKQRESRPSTGVGMADSVDAQRLQQLQAEADKKVRRAQEGQRRAEARIGALDTELDTLHGTLDKVSAKCEAALAELEELRQGKADASAVPTDVAELAALKQRAQQQSETIAKHENALRLFEQERVVLRNANAQLKDTLTANEQEIARLAGQLKAGGSSVPRPPGVKPDSLLDAPPTGRAPDDLKRIRGIGPVLERTLNELGIYFFAQIAAFGDDEIQWVANHINTFPGRIARDRWVEQASALKI